MLNSYLNQTARYQPALRDADGMVMDERGQAQYGPETTVPCRRQPKMREILTADGQKIQTTTVYYLSQQVHEGDLLDGKRVADVSEWATLGGTTMGWKAIC